MVLSKPWTAPHLAGCALGALLLKSLVPPRICQKINSSTEGQNFTEQHLTQLHHTTHTYTHQSRRYMRGGCINKKTPTKQSSKAKDSLELPNHPHPEGAPNMAQNTHAHKRETWTKSSSSTYKECQVYAQIFTSSSILSTSASGSYWSQSL